MADKRAGTIWSTIRWIHPERTDRGTGVTGLRAKLKYFTYRDDRAVKAPRGGRRWRDRGLGQSYQQILHRCQQWQSDSRLAWTLMLSPKPELLALISDEAERRDFMETLTESIVEQWFELRGWTAPAYAYVLHDRATHDEGLAQLHMHVILPGTVETSAGRERLTNRRDDLRTFNKLVEEVLAQELDLELGPSWRERWGEMQREGALKRYFNQIAVDELPDDLPQLAERLHQRGFTGDDIPEHVTDLPAFYAWLENIESDTPDLDAWFGRVER